MKLAQLIEGLEARLLGADVEVRGVEEDSRAVKPGDLFVALHGRTVDGRRFAPAAVAAGAVAVLAEEELTGLALPQVVVPAGRAAAALAVIAGRLAGQPAERMQLVGITGTNGKTTTTYLVESILAAAGLRPGVIGTVSYRFGGTGGRRRSRRRRRCSCTACSPRCGGRDHPRGHGGVVARARARPPGGPRASASRPSPT